MTLLWSYDPEKCDGDFCPNDCDFCNKNGPDGAEYDAGCNEDMEEL